MTFPTIVELIGASPVVQRARMDLNRASSGVDAVLVVAEPGLDAAAVARAIHERSPRSSSPFVAIDCASKNGGTLEHDVFGHHALGGTLLLTDLEELPTPIQARLARVLRDGQVDVDASGRGRLFDVRVIAGISSSVDNSVREGTLRRDLCGRFGLRIEVPPLRQRPTDIPMLIGCLVGESALAAGISVPTFTREALTLLSALPWRRNFDELREVLDVLVRAAVGGTVRLDDVLVHVPLEPVTTSQIGVRSLREARLSFERHYIASVLHRHRGRMEDAARALGIQRTNLYRKVRQLGLGLAKGMQK
jgi:DNA-binding NtrC family response regulator